MSVVTDLTTAIALILNASPSFFFLFGSYAVRLSIDLLLATFTAGSLGGHFRRFGKDFATMALAVFVLALTQKGSRINTAPEFASNPTLVAFANGGLLVVLYFIASVLYEKLPRMQRFARPPVFSAKSLGHMFGDGLLFAVLSGLLALPGAVGLLWALALLG